MQSCCKQVKAVGNSSPSLWVFGCEVTIIQFPWVPGINTQKLLEVNTLCVVIHLDLWSKLICPALCTWSPVFLSLQRRRGGDYKMFTSVHSENFSIFKICMFSFVSRTPHTTPQQHPVTHPKSHCVTHTHTHTKCVNLNQPKWLFRVRANHNQEGVWRWTEKQTGRFVQLCTYNWTSLDLS